jgi:hypothetical protein
MYNKFNEIFESIKNRFHFSSETNELEQHMEDDHDIDVNEENPETVSSIPHSPVQQPDTNNELNKHELNESLNRGNPNYSAEPGYNADDSYSSIQKSKSSSKSGWCYIGEDRGFRSCISVGDNDKCMSGDIFPTNEICVNPNLRV